MAVVPDETKKEISFGTLRGAVVSGPTTGGNQIPVGLNRILAIFALCVGDNTGTGWQAIGATSNAPATIAGMSGQEYISTTSNTLGLPADYLVLGF